MKQRILKQMICFLLAIVMTVSLTPTSVMAAEIETVAEEPVV